LVKAQVLDTSGDWVEAEREFRIALERAGRSGDLGYVFHILAVGDFEKGRSILEAILERDPIHPAALAYLVASHGLLGETAQEEEVFARGNALHGDAWFGGLHEAYFMLARTRTLDASLARHVGRDFSPYLDSPRAGLAEVARLAQTEGFFDTNAGKINLALWAAFFGDDDLAMQLLAAAYEHTAMNAWFIWMPLLHETRQHPEFERLLSDLGLVEYWDEFGWPSICRRVADRIQCD
jgi:hypothetical protein